MAVATDAGSSPLELVASLGKGQNTKTLLRVIILCFIAGAAVASRLFSVIRTCTLHPELVLILMSICLPLAMMLIHIPPIGFESIIHEC